MTNQAKHQVLCENAYLHADWTHAFGGYGRTRPEETPVRALLHSLWGRQGDETLVMRTAYRSHRSIPPRSAFAGFRFPPDVIVVAVRWYLRFGLSYRDVEELLAERGVEVDHVSVYRWVQRFTPLLAEAARPCRHARGRSLVRGRDLCEGRWAMAVCVPSNRSVRPGH